MNISTASNIIVAGVPRGGTTLACKLLNDAPDTLALSEPMAVHLLPPSSPQAAGAVLSYFQLTRQRALTEGRVHSEHRDGRIADNSWGERRRESKRPRIVERGDIQVDKPLSPCFRLAIKHPAAFTALLPALHGRFMLLGIVRNPLAVLASWRSLDLPLSRGRAPAAERFDPSLVDALDNEKDLLRRQVLLLDWYFRQLTRWVPTCQLVRYEDMVSSGGRCLWRAAGISNDEIDDKPMTNRNVNPQYDLAEVDTLTVALKQRSEHWEICYSHDDVVALGRTMAGIL